MADTRHAVVVPSPEAGAFFFLCSVPLHELMHGGTVLGSKESAVIALDEKVTGITAWSSAIESRRWDRNAGSCGLSVSGNHSGGDVVSVIDLYAARVGRYNTTPAFLD